MISMKSYIIHVEDNAKIPEEIQDFTPKENLLMLLIGYNSIKLMRHNSIDDNHTEYIETLKRELEITSTAQKSVYEELLQAEKNRAELISRELVIAQTTAETAAKMRENELTVSILKEKEAFKEREKELQNKINELILKAEQEHNQKLHENLSNTNKMIDELTKNVEELKNSKGNVGRGQLGENFFYDLVVETFAHYDGFSITNTAKTGHSGDFHIHFKDFTILADSKNFIDTFGVSSTDRNKLKFDMKQNTHIKIAWLVSIDKPIRKFTKYPFMIEIHDGVCYCYINSLKEYENPAKLLSMAWYACNLMYHYILNREDDTLVLDKYKKNEIRVREIVEKMRKKSKERYAFIKQLTDNFDETERDILELLNNEIMSIRDVHKNTMQTWWNAHLLRASAGATPPPKLKSGAIYKKFQEENPEISEDMFRQILREIIPAENLEIPKSKNAQYTILNYLWEN